MKEMIYCRYLTDVVYFFLINQKPHFCRVVSYMLSIQMENVDFQ